MFANKNILLTAFCGTSAKTLIKDTKDYKTLFLPNDKIKDSEKLINMISIEEFDYIFSFGQKPNIKNKVYIETTARNGEFQISTNYDYIKLKEIFEQNGIIAKISHNAGTSYCNTLYLNGLKYIAKNHLGVEMIFVHIPFEKNIFDFENFRKSVLESLHS